MDEEGRTIVKVGDTWSDLSSDFGARIQRWMAEGVFVPEIYHPPRSRKPCRLSEADEVVAVILHSLFSKGLRYKDLGQKSIVVQDQDYQSHLWESLFDRFPHETKDGVPFLDLKKDPEAEREIVKTLSSKRKFQAFLEWCQFAAHVHAIPIPGSRLKLWRDGKVMSIMEIPGVVRDERCHAIFLMKSENLDRHLKGIIDEYAWRPSILIDCQAIYRELKRRLSIRKS